MLRAAVPSSGVNERASPMGTSRIRTGGQRSRGQLTLLVATVIHATTVHGSGPQRYLVDVLPRWGPRRPELRAAAPSPAPSKCRSAGPCVRRTCGGAYRRTGQHHAAGFARVFDRLYRADQARGRASCGSGHPSSSSVRALARRESGEWFSILRSCPVRRKEAKGGRRSRKACAADVRGHRRA